MTVDADYLWITGDAFTDMRLLVEGALNLFEDDAGVLCRLAREAGKIEEMGSLNDIGTALYELKRHIIALQEAHYKAETQEPNELEEE